MSMHAWTRRRLLQSSVGAAVVTGPLAPLLRAFPVGVAQEAPDAIASGTIAYATSHDAAGAQGFSGLHVLQRQQREWRETQRIDAERPAAAVLDAAGQYLYVAHATARGAGAPAGRVTVHRVDPASGRLQRCAEQRLALAATQPVAIALAPRQDLLVVASEQGMFSLLETLPHGDLQPVSAAYKDLPLAMAAGPPVAMHFLESGELAVHTHGIARHFCCAPQGMALTRSAPGCSGSLHAALPLALAGFPHLRCVALKPAEQRTDAVLA